MSKKVTELTDGGRMLQNDVLTTVRGGENIKCFPDGAGHAANILQSSVGIVLGTIDTYEQVDGTWVIQPSAQYFINNATNSGELEYTDDRDRFTLLVFNATITTSANNTIVTTTFTQNGTPNLNYEIIRTKATAMDQEAISISADLKLSMGDTIGVAVMADKTGTVTFVKSHMTAVNVYYGGVVPFP